jgi:hypothetical protein
MLDGISLLPAPLAKSNLPTFSKSLTAGFGAYDGPNSLVALDSAHGICEEKACKCYPNI